MKIAGVQIDIQLAQPEANLARIVEHLNQAADQGARLIVFPECALTGYCFESLEAARPFGQTIPGPATDQLAELCKSRDLHVVFGMLESDGEHLFNAAVLVTSDGRVATYRKVHLPFLGIDRFTTYGDRPFDVHEIDDVRIGMNICYDVSFPEAARCLTLLGADLIVLPTNWPPGAECVAQNSINCRAIENGVYYLAVNRVGTEGGFPFIGQSQLCSPDGRTIHYASKDAEEVFYAEIDPAESRRKHCVRVPGKHEIDRLADRRPAMYGPINEPHDLRSPGR